MRRLAPIALLLAILFWSNIAFSSAQEQTCRIALAARGQAVIYELETHAISYVAGEIPLAWSADGEVLYTIDSDSNMPILYAVDGDSPSQIGTLPSSLAAISPDMSYIAVLDTSAKSMQLLRFEDLTIERTIDLPVVDSIIGFARPFWSPNGQAIGFGISTLSGQVIIGTIDIGNGDIAEVAIMDGTLSLFPFAVNAPVWSADGSYVAVEVDSPGHTTNLIEVQSGETTDELPDVWLPTWVDDQEIVGIFTQSSSVINYEVATQIQDDLFSIEGLAFASTVLDSSLVMTISLNLDADTISFYPSLITAVSESDYDIRQSIESTAPLILNRPLWSPTCFGN